MEDLIEVDQLTSIKIIPKNMFIQMLETFSQRLYFIKKGKVRLYKLNAMGKQFTSDILNEGNVLGEMDFISFGTYDNYIETIEDSHISFLNKT